MADRSDPLEAPAPFTLSKFDQCSHCHKAPHQLTKPLKRCQGCSVALYCSKECQKAAWPVHRTVCKSDAVLPGAEPCFQRLGYPTLMTIMGALNTWLAIHVITFEYLANAVVWVNGGVDYNLATPRALVIHVGARKRRSDNDNPATAIFLKSVEILPKGSRVYLGDHWYKLEENRVEREPLYRKILPPNFVGLMLTVAVLEVPGYGPVACQAQFPLFRPVGDGGKPLDEKTITALGDITSMISASIAIGHSYERPVIYTQALPEVDHRVRSKKTWKKERLEKWDWDVQMTRLMRDRPESHKLKSGLGPVALWDMFSKLCWGVST